VALTSKVEHLRAHALQALREGDIHAAIRHLRKATRLQPREESLFHELAECHWANYQFDLALEVYDAAVQTSPTSVQTATLAAKKLFSLGRFTDSANWLERALVTLPNDPALLVMLGEVYERAGKLKEAEQSAQKVLSLAPFNPKAVRLMAHVERRLEKLEEAEKRLTFQLGKYPGPEDWRLRYEVAAVLDRLGRYNQAFAQLLAAKEQLRAHAEPALREAQLLRQRQQEVAQQLQRSDFEQWQKESSRLKKVKIAFLCGHPRSGTTLLEQILDAHPNAVSTDETGVLLREFIAPVLRQPPSARDSVEMICQFQPIELSHGRATYLKFTEAHLGEPIANRLLVEKEPTLTPDLPLPVRLFPESRIIFPLRDPRDVCISYFFTLVPLAASSAAALDLRSTCQFCAHSLEMWSIWKRTLATPLLESKYEDLVAAPETHSRKVLEFLGLPWDEKVTAFEKRPRLRGIRTPTYADAAQPVHTRAVGRWKNYEEHLGPCLDLLRPHLRRFGYE
jgi:tetratricopeptide (TPR) repeat protein